MHLAMVLMQSGPDSEQVQKMVMAMFAILPILILIGAAIVLVPFWFICKKAGFSPWLSLLNLIPLGNLVLLYVLAFADWKVAPVPQVWPMQPPYPPQG
jgi:hypothetical protein